MKTYNETIGELDREIDRIYNIAFTRMRQAEYRLREDIIKDSYNSISATECVTTTIVSEREIVNVQREMEDLFKLRERIQAKLRLLYDHEE